MADFEDLDVSVIEGHEWAKQLRSSILANTDKYVLNWCLVVLELGENEVDLNDWIGIFKREIDDRCQQLVMDVIDMKSKIVDRITELLSKIHTYNQQLCLEDDLMNISPTEKLYQVHKELKKKADMLENMMAERQNELDSLLSRQAKLCKALDKPPFDVPKSPIPPRSDIEDLQRYVELLEQEKFNREENYLHLKEAIIKMAAELDLSPKSDFEREVLATTHTEFDVSETNMKNVKKFHDDLVLQLKNMKEEIDNLRQTVGDLWTVLEESITERDSFNDRFSGYSIDALKALRAEVKRCEELKKANIRVFVEKLRSELYSLWETCYHKHEEELGNYRWLTSDFYTEDVLFYHEREVSKWKNFYSKNEELIKLFAELQRLWNSLLEMENKDTAGMQRYKNRGGQLLKEEKERNKLAKKIPLIEEKIKLLAADYNDNYGTCFVIFGVPILEYIDDLHAKRDQDRKIKLSAKKQIREILTPAKSCMSLFPSTSRSCITPQPPPSLKRRILKPQTTGKKAKTAEKTVQNKLNLSSLKPHTIDRNRRLSREKQRRIMKCRKMLSMKQKNDKENEDDSNITNYDTFERNLSTNCRSTLCAVIPIIQIEPATPGRSAIQPVTPRTPKSTKQITRTPSSLKLIF